MANTNTYDYEISSKGLGYNKPQEMGRKLWAPMLVMSLMAFAVGIALAISRATIVSDFGVADEGALRLSHLIPAVQFIGFLAVFSAVSFAIARILGAFRKGGGEVQEAAGTQVQTLKMPKTAKLFMASMAMGMMIILAMVVLHFVAAANVGTWSVETLARWGDVLEGFRRLGVALYLFGITFGLGTIITVLRFQAARVRQLPAEARA
jgi:hypothetical protein